MIRTTRAVVAPDAPNPQAVAAAARVIRAGGLVAFPTETFYGLGADALNATAVARVFEAKGRPADKPLLVLVDSIEMIRLVVREVPARAHRLMGRYWPGPLTLVLWARREVPVALTAGSDTIGVRLAGHPLARQLVTASGTPVTAPSANPHGGASPCTADEVIQGLGDRVDLVLDGGRTPGGLASTVVDLTRVPPVVLRAGAVTLTADELEGEDFCTWRRCR